MDRDRRAVGSDSVACGRARGRSIRPRTASTTIGASRPSTPASHRGRPTRRACTCTSAAATSCASPPSWPTTSSPSTRATSGSAGARTGRWSTPDASCSRRTRAFDEFERRLREVDLERLVGEEKTLAPAALRERNLRLLERLNPGRVFRIRMPVDELVRRWSAEVRPEDHRRLDGARRLELVNLLLPTRLWVTELEPGVGRDLDALVARAVTPGATPTPELRAAYLALLARVSHGLYPVRDGALAFDEFTAIYPVGTFNEYTTWNGRRIPVLPDARTPHAHDPPAVAHRRPHPDRRVVQLLAVAAVHARRHQHAQLLPHAVVADGAARTDFLPAAWRSGDHDDRDGRPYRYLWLLSRGPMSHGCTHVNAGHIAELRQLLPAETERLYDVDVFYNQSQLYDVFDIDGDLTPEVMGVALLRRLLAARQDARSAARTDGAARLLRLALRRRPRLRRRRSRRLPRRARRALRRPERRARARATPTSRSARRPTSPSACSSIVSSTSRSRASCAR